MKMGDTSQEYVELMAKLSSMGVEELVVNKELYESLLRFAFVFCSLNVVDAFDTSEFRFYGILIREEDNSNEENIQIHGKFTNTYGNLEGEK